MLDSPCLASQVISDAQEMSSVVKGTLHTCMASLVAQRLKPLPAMRETWVRSLGQEDPLDKEIATHSSTLAWRIPWTEEPGGLQSTGSLRVGHDWQLHFHFLGLVGKMTCWTVLPLARRMWYLSCRICYFCSKPISVVYFSLIP